MRAWRDGCEAASVTSMHLVCSAWFGSVFFSKLETFICEDSIFSVLIDFFLCGLMEYFGLMVF